jgi:hypothetical protein
MTVEKFLETLQLVRSTDSELQLQKYLETVSNTLANLTNSPAEPSYQSTLATALANLKQAAAAIPENLSVAELKAIASIQGAEYFDPLIGEKVAESVSNNAMTPSVARDYVKQLATRRAAFLRTVETAASELVELGVTGYELKPGGSDVSFTIPRDLFSNELGSFATELRFLDRLILDISEATLGQPEPPVLEALSTTNPIVAIFAQPQVLEALAKAVNLFLDAWAKIEEIRKVRADVSRIGISGAALQQFDEKIEETVTEVVEESVKMSLGSYSSDNGRKNELGNALSQDMRRLFGQIERGLIVEFRAEPDKKADDENAQALLKVRDIGKGLRYPTPEAQPLLLASGEVLEGEITRTTKKKTITTKVVKRDGASEPSSKQ